MSADSAPATPQSREEANFARFFHPLRTVQQQMDFVAVSPVFFDFHAAKCHSQRLRSIKKLSQFKAKVKFLSK
jgi:hypothetical protein